MAKSAENGEFLLFPYIINSWCLSVSPNKFSYNASVWVTAAVFPPYTVYIGWADKRSDIEYARKKGSKQWAWCFGWRSRQWRRRVILAMTEIKLIPFIRKAALCSCGKSGEKKFKIIQWMPSVSPLLIFQFSIDKDFVKKQAYTHKHTRLNKKTRCENESMRIFLNCSCSRVILWAEGEKRFGDDSTLGNFKTITI